MRPAKRHKRIKIVGDRLEPLKVGVVENELLQSGAPLVEFDGERPVISPLWYICECLEGRHALDETRQ